MIQLGKYNLLSVVSNYEPGCLPSPVESAALQGPLYPPHPPPDHLVTPLGQEQLYKCVYLSS